MSLDQLVTRFNLGAVEKLKLNNALSVVWHELTEARGANAQVEYYDGTRLVIYVPGLVLSDDALIQVVVGRFNESLGEQKTLAILSDPQGKAAVDELLSIELLRRGSRYRFERISAKNDSGKNLPLENALFNLTWKYDTPSGNLAREIAESGWSNWSIPETYNIQLGWNAMSKAPQGYFRAEPIAGAQSKPAPSPTLIRDLDTGTIQILNDKYPGSVEIIDAPKG